ncbi:hypothetical protein ACH5RR_029847 [Cinchona calisaya]|uniref:Cytochrome P450 n=1 Tax=Cinchona calisaya TaxID=153742 RepID=A0ABD2YV46_9GENT
MVMGLSSIFLLLLCSIPAVYFCLDKLLIRKGSPNDTQNISVEKPKLPPGSMGWPLIGESLDYFSKLQQGQAYKFLTERWKKYSSNTFMTSLIGEPMVIICNAEGNKFIFSNEKKLVQLWWPSTISKIFSKSDDKSSNEHALTLHKMLHFILKGDGLREYVGIMDTVMKEHLQIYRNCKQMKVGDISNRYLLTLSSNIFIGISDPGKIEKLAKQLKDVEAALVSMPINFPGTALNRAIKAYRLIIKDLSATIRQRRIDLSRHRSSSRKDFMSIMLSVKDDNGKFFCDDDINSHLAGLLLASYTTTRSTIFSIMKYLAELPEVYNFVLREQQAIADGKEPNDMLNWEDLQKMKYSWNVACEVLRISTPGVGGFREAITDFTYEGYTIQRGLKIHWASHATHMNPKYFHDPEKFDPSRFEGDGPAPYTFVPFGGGPRMCPGNEYARVAILTFLHNMVTCFRWEKLDPDEKIIHFPVPRPTQGFPILLHPHNL